MNIDKMDLLVKLLKQRDQLDAEQQLMLDDQFTAEMTPDNLIQLWSLIEEQQIRMESMAGGDVEDAVIIDAKPAEPEQKEIGFCLEADLTSGMCFKVFDTAQAVRDYFGDTAKIATVFGEPIRQTTIRRAPPAAAAAPAGSSVFTEKEAASIRISNLFVYDQLWLVYGLLNPAAFPKLGQAVNQAVAIHNFIDAKIGPAPAAKGAKSQPTMADVINSEMRKQS